MAYTYSVQNDPYQSGSGEFLSDVGKLTGLNANKNARIPKLFENTKQFKDVTQYNLMRGVPDFGSLVQFNPYETGYACFIVCGIPKFIEALARARSEYEALVENWIHIIEYEFKTFDGLQDMSADTYGLGDDLNTLNIISKVNMQSATEFTLTYDEKSGSPLTKFAKLYLTGIKDPRTQVKTYHGLIHGGVMEPGFENEVFTFLYINTDNTMREVEAAYLLIACQLQSADTDMYNFTKGDINKREVSVKFSGYPITSSLVDMAAADMMKFLLSQDAKARQIVVNSNEFTYTGISAITDTLTSYGATDKDEYTSLEKVGGLYDADGRPKDGNKASYDVTSWDSGELFGDDNNRSGQRAQRSGSGISANTSFGTRVKNMLNL